jgi:hypothetical protein
LGPEPEKLATSIMRQYKITSADLLAREDITVDQLVDVIQGNRQYKPCLYLYNKIDTVTIEEVDKLARMPHSIVGSVVKKLNIGEPHEDDLVKSKMWEYLGLTRVYTKRKGAFSFFACVFLGVRLVCVDTNQSFSLLQANLLTWRNLLSCQRFGKAQRFNHYVRMCLRKCCGTLITLLFGGRAPSIHRNGVA